MTQINSASLGKKGEQQAVNALEEAGLKIIAQNIRSKYGEIDIVAADGNTIVFIEVKAWSVFGMDDLQYSINARKQQKIIKTAKYFLSENRKYSNMSIRFDVIFVKKNSISHLASAFTECV